MKIKLFQNTSVDELEQEINNFVADKDVFDIKYQVSFTPSLLSLYHVLVIYGDLDISDNETPEYNFQN